MPVIHFYQLCQSSNVITRKVQSILKRNDFQIASETCYNVDIDKDSTEQLIEIVPSVLRLLSYDFPVKLDKPYLYLEESEEHKSFLFEIGPRLNQRTPFCTNATSICWMCGLTNVKGIEQSWRYKVTSKLSFSNEEKDEVIDGLLDAMTQCRYFKPLESLEANHISKPWYSIDVINGKSKALQAASDDLGLAFDDWDIKFYANLFRHQLKRNPTSVECFDLAQSNSEHSRHWFFKAKFVIEGEEKPMSLFAMVTDTLNHSSKNNKIAFHDNGSAIQGREVMDIVALNSGQPSEMVSQLQLKHLALTAETHNFPTGVAPFPGATTGTGGRQRDQHAIGRGSSIVAGTAGYCVGNLNIPNYPLAWEDSGDWLLASNLAPARRIAIEASDGASDYGNKFGEPVIAGFFRSFGMRLPGGERCEWVKPIMFSGGISSINEEQLNKKKLDANTSGLLVAKIGGPAYRIGVGGGCASSQMHGANDASRDFNAVQRGDAEMQQKLHRVVRACVEHQDNPLLSIHDQGAGGNGNVLKEIVEPSGAVIHSKAFTLGDKSLNTLELWTAEYQESDAVLVDRTKLPILKRICHRERCNLDVVGELNGTGRMVLSDQEIRYEDGVPVGDFDEINNTKQHPVDLDLQLVLGKMPQKIYNLIDKPRQLKCFDTKQIAFSEALDRVLRLPSVASKRFLTNKVDRSVTGLIAQQQCCGPLHTPLADVAVTALSHFSTVGTATSIGEQPIKMLVDQEAGARLAVGEALSNMLFAAISDIRDIKCSANWMWPAKLPGEGARIYKACQAMCDVMKELGIAVDGGKDSLSMAATVGEEIVKCPGSLVISAYAPCTDITKTITPDLKAPGGSAWLVYVPLSNCKPCLGGTALAQCYHQLGDQVADLDDPTLFVGGWCATQRLVKERVVCSGHDVSDGGLVTCALEMAFAGNRGLELTIEARGYSAMEFLFSENLGIILETDNPDRVIEEYKLSNVAAVRIGMSFDKRKISINFNGEHLLDDIITNELRDVWESSSFALERLQCDERCVDAERNWMLEECQEPCFFMNDSMKCGIEWPLPDKDIKVAILREEGSNGDREMAAAFIAAGFKPWDVTMQDLIDEAISLDRFRGLIFVGGFSYADVFGSAKGWAACCIYNDRVRYQLEAFRRRTDVFSLGVCNGCQLMALLGWVGLQDATTCKEWNTKTPPLYLGSNQSNRFESRYCTVNIPKSKSIMLEGMEGAQIGVWVAHGEGKFCFDDDVMVDRTLDEGMISMAFIDHKGDWTTSYPHNPNGSPRGIAAICSRDGRHLAMMPHPERSFKLWQLPYLPTSCRDEIRESPWLRMFQNALRWCHQSQ